MMPIGFRCTGCRSRLHVPKRWAGNTLPCPKCGTRVVVPAAAKETDRGIAARDEPTAFEDKAVERSLATLQVPWVGKPGGIFAEDSFELPSPDDVHASLSTGKPGHGRITLSRRALSAYLAVIPVVAVAAFLLGYWWKSAWGP
jgi:predicted RNA-binding Zn-ribbon protein involved in translation (DUF1610 family)